MRLKIRKFDPAAQMKPHRISLLIGRRGTGKTVLLEDLMSHIKHTVDFGLAFTPTAETQDMLRKHMPDACVYSAYSAAVLERMLALQRASMAKNKTRALYLVTDDCTYDKSVFKGASVRDLFMNGRHANVAYISAMQYCMDMTPDLRTQVDYVFALKESIISNKKKLWQFFFGMFSKYEDFSRTMDQCCENFGCLVLDNTAPTNRIEDCVFWYRAEPSLPPFRMGRSVFHRLASRHQKTPEEAGLSDAARVRDLVSIGRGSRAITSVERTDRRGRTIEEDGDSLIVE